MSYSHYATNLITINKYKGKTFEELGFEILNNDKKYISILHKTLNSSKTPNDKKVEIQNFLNYFFNCYEPSHQPSQPQETPLIQSHPFWVPPISQMPFSNMITHIIHISDIHIRLYSRSKEYQNVFQKLYLFIEISMSKNPNQIIVITGDLLHSKNTLSPECIITTQNFLIKLSSMATTILIAGNHDALLTNNQREDSITAIVDKIQIPNFYYLKNSGVYLFGNIAFAVNSLLDNKWIYANSFQVPEQITHKIALYHGGVGLCDTGVGHRLRGEKLVEDFDGYDYGLLGDIHKFQFMDDEKKRIAYASSLIAQNFNEWNSPHGVLHWDIFNKNHQYYPIENDCGFFVFNLNNNNIFVENEQIMEEDIPNYLQKSSMNVKLNIQNCSTEFISKINYLIKQSCQDVKLIHNYLGSKTKEVQPEININTNTLLIQYIQKNSPNLPQEDQQFILDKYNEYAYDVEINNEQNLSRWELIDIEFSNLFGYGQNNFIDFSRFSSDNPIGIIAPNSHGKSSLIDIILLTLFTKFSRSRGTGISKDIINVNATTFQSKLRFKIGNDMYVIIKEGKREHTDKVKITKNEFYKQNETMILLTDEDRKKTDKIISELIGTYDDFIFTNVQLQNRTNSFKEMTDKERKEYLYKVLKLNIWNDIAKRIIESIKPLKNSITYLEKTIENKSIEEFDEKMQDIELQIEFNQDKIEQQLYEKEINLEILNNERERLIPNLASEKYDENDILSQLKSNKKKLEQLDPQIENINTIINSIKSQSFSLLKKKDEIIAEYLKKQNENNKEIQSIENKLKNYNLQALIPTSNLWSKIKNRDDPEKILKNIEESINSIEELSLSNEIEEINNNLINQQNDIQSIKDKLQELQNEKIIYKNKIHLIKEESIPDLSNLPELKSKFKLKSKEREVVQSKINNFQNELESPIFVNWKEEKQLIENIKRLEKEEIELKSLLKNYENHEYDPKCKFCMKHPIIKQKEEKEIQLKNIQQEISNIKKNLKTKDPESIEVKYLDIQSKLQEKQTKLITLDALVIKIELELEKLLISQEKLNDINKKKEENEQINLHIQSLSSEIQSINQDLSQKEKIYKKLQQEFQEIQSQINNNQKSIEKLNNQKEIILEIIEIDSKNKIIEQDNKIIDDMKLEISQLNDEFNNCPISKKYQKLQEELSIEIQIKLDISQQEIKLQELSFQKINTQNQIKELEKILEDIQLSKESLLFNEKIRSNIDIFQSRISKNESLTAKLNEKLGVLYQQYKDIINNQKIYLSQLDELKTKRNEYKLMQLLEQSLGKDGLPLVILENYLVPITQSINNIISPFISRKINLRIDNDDLILDSFPDNNDRSVYIHGGMESFILDIAFKITLSNFAKLPKCDILFLDEGISAFDNERLSNIDTLFNFIKRYFSKTILITHIDSVKENIIEKIGIIKENNLSKIICEYSS